MNNPNLEIVDAFDGRVKMIYLNNPETFNALDKSILTDLKHLIIQYSEDVQTRCIAIAAKGKAFCSGQNLKSAEEMIAHKNEQIVKQIVQEYYNPLVKAIAECKKPVISLVQGPAVGAGAMLALICDFTLAADQAYFMQAFSNIGLIPDTGGTYFLPKLLGLQQANYLAFTGKKLMAADALKLGLIADVFPAADFEAATQKVLAQLSNAATLGLHLTKKAFLLSYNNSLEEQLSVEADLQQQAAESADFEEGVTAFLNKKLPTFKGA